MPPRNGSARRSGSARPAYRYLGQMHGWHRNTRRGCPRRPSRRIPAGWCQSPRRRYNSTAARRSAHSARTSSYPCRPRIRHCSRLWVSGPAAVRLGRPSGRCRPARSAPAARVPWRYTGCFARRQFAPYPGYTPQPGGTTADRARRALQTLSTTCVPDWPRPSTTRPRTRWCLDRYTARPAASDCRQPGLRLKRLCWR